MEITKQILMHAIVGAGFKSMTYADAMTKRGLAKFCGNQWNEDWEWDIKVLDKYSFEELLQIYTETTGD